MAHNRYREAQPSGENTIVDAEIAQLTAAGVEVLPFLRSSDEIPSMSKPAKALLPISPIWAPKAQHDLDRLLVEHRPDVLHLHNPYPLLSPWVVRTAHKRGVPVVQTVHNYRQVCSSGLYFRDGVICQDCRGRALGVPAIVHRCYRDSRAQSALMATTLAVHRPTWRSVDRFIALTSAVADHLRDYGIPDERIVVKPNAVPDPGTPTPVGDGFLFMGRLSPEKGWTCCSRRGGDTRWARSARCASPVTASCARWPRRPPPSGPTCATWASSTARGYAPRWPTAPWCWPPRPGTTCCPP